MPKNRIEERAIPFAEGLPLFAQAHRLAKQTKPADVCRVRDEGQRQLFNHPAKQPAMGNWCIIDTNRQYPQERYFHIQNRRYLGNKFKLVNFINEIVIRMCGSVRSFCDIFAGTGVVGARFNNPQTRIIANDILAANYICLRTFLVTSGLAHQKIARKIAHLNNLHCDADNYFSSHFGGTYFSQANARKIGTIREEIESIAASEDEKNILICSLLYATDKVANTVGHYDAFRKNLDMTQPIQLLIPALSHAPNPNNEVYKEDANELIKKIACDVLYIDPPYNSRQYSDAYHLLENLAEWNKPAVTGLAKKMDRTHIKSTYCRQGAASALADLIRNADCKHILLSYNNTGDSKDGRSNARISDTEIMQILTAKGKVEIFKKNYKAFTTGRSQGANNAERIFYCRVA